MIAWTDRQTDEAVRRFKTAISLNPNFAAAYGYIGLALVFDGRSDEALRYFEQVMRMSPRDPSTHFFAGISVAFVISEEVCRRGRMGTASAAAAAGHPERPPHPLRQPRAGWTNRGSQSRAEVASADAAGPLNRVGQAMGALHGLGRWSIFSRACGRPAWNDFPPGKSRVKALIFVE